MLLEFMSIPSGCLFRFACYDCPGMSVITLPQPSVAPRLRPWEPLKQWRRRIAAGAMRRRVRCRDFSIISNDCWGGMACEELGMRYESPFVGLFVVPADYIRMLGDLKATMQAEPEFRGESRHESINRWRSEINRAYPIGVLPGDIEIQFLHYSSASEALQKWRRRTARINWEKLRVKISWHDDPEIEQRLREFARLPFAAKVCLTPRVVADCHSVVLRDFSTDGTQQYWRGHKAFDVAAFLERGEVCHAWPVRLLDWALYWHY